MSLALRERHFGRGGVENSVLKRIFGPYGVEVTGNWRKVRNELNNLYSSPDIIRITMLRRMSGEAFSTQGRVNVYNTLVGKLEGMRFLGRCRRGFEGNIKMGLRKYGCIVWTAVIWLWMGSITGCCEDGNIRSCPLRGAGSLLCFAGVSSGTLMQPV